MPIVIQIRVNKPLKLSVLSCIGVGRCFTLGGPKHILSYMESDYVVQSTTRMRSMLKLGGLGACPPRKILKITCSEIDFGGNFTCYNHFLR